jgi:hypothetical protein
VAVKTWKSIRTLKEAAVTVVGEIESYQYGKFGWMPDQEGNKIKLWEAADFVFDKRNLDSDPFT